MPDETIFCPECQSKVKVPETLLGQAVTCPLCRHTFTAPIRGGGSIVPAPLPTLTAVEPQATGTVKAPALALMVVGIIGFAVNLLSLTIAIRLGPQEYLQMQENAFNQLNWPMPQMDADQVFQQALLFQGIGAALALCVIVGASQMMRLQWYGLAIAACVLAMINAINCCCLLGVPIGLWSLSVLLRPEVKASFQ
jgi:hypothetical protein